MSELTESLGAYQPGDRKSLDRIFSVLYPDLTRLARSRLRNGQRMTLVDTSGLVHECYERFLRAGSIQVQNRAHFFAYSAQVMQSVIIDCARRRSAERRGGDAAKVTLDTNIAENAVAAEDQLLEMAEAIEQLEKLDERLASVVKMRYFAGLSEKEIATALGKDERTVRRYFEKAYLLLKQMLRP